MDIQDPYSPQPLPEPPVIHPMPPMAPKRSWGREVLKFLGLFLGFFILISLIVMGPTLYTRVGYLFHPPKNTYDIPAEVGTDVAAISSLQAQVDSSTKFPDQDSVLIPKIGVEAPLVYITSPDNNAILEGIKNGVGHYPGTALPGRVGNVFLTGHSSYYWWSGGKYNQVFANLDKLKPGDLVYINYKGGRYIYRIKDSFVVNPSQTEVLEQGDEPILTLMTCTPVGTNLRRLIVRADLVGRPPIVPTDFSEFAHIPKLPTFLPVY